MTIQELMKLIPTATDTQLRNAINSETEAEFNSGNFNSYEAEQTAINRVLTWYREAGEELDAVRQIGVITYVNNYRSAKVFATLLAFRDMGVAELPL